MADCGPVALYEQNEHVMAYHGSSMFPAKVLRVSRSAAGSWSYYIHYSGWKSTWDEWVPCERLTQLTDANRERARVMNEAAAAVAKATKAKRTSVAGARSDDAGATVSAVPGSGASKKRKGADALRDCEDDSETGALELTVARKLAVPLPLKRVIVEDWECITQKHMLHRIPAGNGASASALLDAYLAHISGGEVGVGARAGEQAADGAASALPVSGVKSSKKSLPGRVSATLSKVSSTAASLISGDPLAHAVASRSTGVMTGATESSLASSSTRPAASIAAARAVVAALRAYFDRALPAFLLYRFERLQYASVLQQQPEVVPLEASERGGSGTSASKLPSLPLSQVYSGHHLLRLFIKLPELVSHSGMSQDQAEALTLQLQDVLKFLSKNIATFFPASSFSKPTDLYLQRAEAEAEAASRSGASTCVVE